MNECVVGVDGGGTSTTAVVVAPDETVLGRAEGGGASPQHNRLREAHDAVQGTVRRALADAGRSPEAVESLTAGLAGLNQADDRQWARALVSLPGLGCEPVAHNDAVVAHAGSLGGEPGIVAISGTGSIVLGIDDAGRQVRNYDLNHYAESAARHLGERLVHRLLGGEATDADADFIADVFDQWDLTGMAALREAAVDGDLLATTESGNALDAVAPLVTAAAAERVGIARSVCEAALTEVVTGVRAVDGALDGETTTVAVEGSVLGSRYMRERLTERLADAERSFTVVEPAQSTAYGAALLALDRVEWPKTDRSAAE